MADSTIQLPPNSTGTKLRAFGPLPDTSFVEAFAPVDANGDQFPESPQVSVLSSVALAAGASVTLQGTIITNGTVGRLVLVSIAASVPLKVEIQLHNTVRDRVWTTDLELHKFWKPPHPNFARLTGDGTNRYKVTLTNQDTIDAADVYATLYWDEVA